MELGQAEEMRRYIDQVARVQTVGRRVLLALPPPPAGTPPGEWYGVLWPKASPITARLFGHPPDAAGRVVAWVHPETLAAGQLQVGDRITAVDGTPLAVAEATGISWPATRTLTIVRGGESRTIRMQPEVWPRKLVFVALADDTPNAVAVADGVVVTTALLDLVPSDDALAWIVGHELAHITLGHTEQKVTPGKILKGIVGVGVLLPAQILVPGSGQVLGGLMQGVENRFNRDQERDADRLGVHYTRAAGYDPSAALVVLDTLQTKVPVGTVTQFLDVHPPYPERRELITAEIAAASGP